MLSASILVFQSCSISFSASNFSSTMLNNFRHTVIIIDLTDPWSLSYHWRLTSSLDFQDLMTWRKSQFELFSQRFSIDSIVARIFRRRVGNVAPHRQHGSEWNRLKWHRTAFLKVYRQRNRAQRPSWTTFFTVATNCQVDVFGVAGCGTSEEKCSNFNISDII